MRIYQVVLAVCAVLALSAGVAVATPAPLVLPWLSETNTTAATSPFIRNDWNIFATELGWSPARVQGLRQRTLTYLGGSKFVLPVSTATFDPDSLITTIPGYGEIYSQYNDANGAYVPATGNLYALFPGTRIKEGEFCFQATSNANIYGGEYGIYLESVGRSPQLTIGDTICVGEYYVVSDFPIAQDHLTFQGNFPLGQPVAPTVIYEENTILSDKHGPGCETVIIHTAPIAPTYQLTWTSVDTAWKFPCPSNIYTILGI